MKNLTSDRGTIFLETAMVMPLFMIMLCLCVDLPRIMQVRQRLGGCGRLVAEIRARNQGDSTLIDSDSLTRYFFDRTGGGIKLNIDFAADRRSMISEGFKDIQDWLSKYLGNFVEKAVDFLLNFITAGNFDPFILNVFNNDRFFAGKVSADMPTLISSDFYNFATGTSGPATHIEPPYTTFWPSCDSCKYTGKPFIESVLDWLHDHFDL